jgi:hypothetical protein
MILNGAGHMIRTWGLAIPGKYSRVELDGYIIMPNHCHGIIKIVGADQCVCPDPSVCPEYFIKTANKCEHMGSPLQRQFDG